ncbi:intraflagellar transport 122 homolog [Paramuricea clavata]|uniref:Intraflagellar transport 122 homolog n=1 Tax=Paramuricea clavata TaxID=317549 RepID=A0A6S7HZA4_PARCT|nr:intraflagellar transport 122 homolog [Paramuricea clavata]
MGIDGKTDAEMLRKFHQYQTKAEIYHLYHSIQRYTDEPFTDHLPEALFNIARYLLHLLLKETPLGISRVATLFALSKQGKHLGAYKMARYAYDKLQSLKVPARFQELIDVGSITIRSKPFSDNEEVLPLCYRCSTTNPLLNSKGNHCINCRQPFVFSFSSFDVLPLVEFVLEDGISDEEAVKLIEADVVTNRKKDKSQWNEVDMGNVQSLQISDEADGGDDDDPFTEKLMSFEEFIGSGDAKNVKHLIKQQAEWAKSSNDPRAAADMYLTAGEHMKAIELIGENGWVEKLLEVGRNLNKAETEALKKCAHYFVKMDQHDYATEMYVKMGDIKSLIKLHVDTRHWDEAFHLLEKQPDLKDDVYIPYANWLAENDRFDEAQEAFHKSGQQHKAVQVLEQLTHNAVVENRFNDAGYYYWKLSMQCLHVVLDQDGKTDTEMLRKFHQYQTKAEIYHLYHSIQRYTDEPFTDHLPEALFNIARYLLHLLLKETPLGISRVATLFALSKQGKHLGAYKMARYAYDKLQSLKVPARFQELIDVGSITIRSKPFSDNEEVLPLCYRCSTTNPLLNSKGNHCINCRQPFVFSFSSFDVLPLVEFVLEDGISDEEAVKLIEADVPANRKKDKSQWNEVDMGNVQSLQISDEADGGDDDDPFTEKLMSFEQGGTEFIPVKVGRAVLQSMNRHEVFIKRWPQPLKFNYYKSIMPDVAITLCQTCNRMFHSEDYDLLVLQKGHCPFCRKAAENL